MEPEKKTDETDSSESERARERAGEREVEQEKKTDETDSRERERARERAGERGVEPEKKTDETDINQVRPDCEERHIQKTLLTPRASVSVFVLMSS